MAKWIPELSQKSAPLRELLDEKNEWSWLEKHDAAFDELKTYLTKEPTLVFYDPGKPIKLSSDASKDGLGAVILQLHEDKWKPVAYASRALTSAETRYAQIEKELLSIAFACTRFHQYIYGATVQAETDHKPLVSIFKKPLADCPIRIQRLLLQLQRYDLQVSYTPGKLLVTADTLSRATEKTNTKITKVNEDTELYVNTVIETMPLSDQRLEEVRKNTNEDEEMTMLKNIILKGWPRSKVNCPPEVIEYWNARDNISVASDLVMKGSKIVIPKAMRQYALEKIHEGHMGIDKCRRRGREVLYWPHINNDIEQMVKNCSSCLTYSNREVAEPLHPHEIPVRPWQRVASDLFLHNAVTYLVVTDYYSYYPEVLTMRSTSSKAVIDAIKSVFARHGTPDVLISDNGPQYASAEFQRFSMEWKFKHQTSSPHFPSSNGLAESAVKTVKRILQKSLDSNSDFYQSLQAYRATPLANGRSPAQLLMQRRIKTSLPIHHSLLKTSMDDEIVETKIQERTKQKERFDKSARALPVLETDEKVRMYNYHDKTWDVPARVVQELSPRSYLVETEEGVKYRRNRRDLKIAPAGQAVMNIEPDKVTETEATVQPSPEPVSVLDQAVPEPVRRSQREKVNTKRYIEEME